jgi:hypothetical protein
MSKIVLPSTFDVKKLSISPIKALPSGAKQAYVSYDGERLVMQTASAMTAPFGLNIADKFGPPQYSLDISFRGADQKPEIKQFMESMKALDEYLLNEAAKNSRAWFRQEMNKDILRFQQTPTVKYSKDKEGAILDYPPNMKLKLRKQDDEFVTKFYDLKGTPYKGVPVQDLLLKGVQVTCIIECTGVWFAGGKFGLTWNAKQVAIHKVPEKISDFAFKGLGAIEAEDEEDEEEKPSSKSASASASASSSNEIDDDEVFAAPSKSVVSAMMPQAAAAAASSSVDDDAGDDIEPVAPPVKSAPTIKRKVIAKK